MKEGKLYYGSASGWVEPATPESDLKNIIYYSEVI